MWRTLTITLALLLVSGCATLRDGPLPGEDLTLPFQHVAQLPEMALTAHVCPPNQLAASGDFSVDGIDYRLFVRIDAQRFTRFMVIDFEHEIVWLGEVVQDDELRVRETRTLTDVATRYPDPCDYLAPVPKGLQL